MSTATIVDEGVDEALLQATQTRERLLESCLQHSLEKEGRLEGLLFVAVETEIELCFDQYHIHSQFGNNEGLRRRYYRERMSHLTKETIDFRIEMAHLFHYSDDYLTFMRDSLHIPITDEQYLNARPIADQLRERGITSPKSLRKWNADRIKQLDEERKRRERMEREEEQERMRSERLAREQAEQAAREAQAQADQAAKEAQLALERKQREEQATLEKQEFENITSKLPEAEREAIVRQHEQRLQEQIAAWEARKRQEIAEREQQAREDIARQRLEQEQAVENEVFNRLANSFTANLNTMSASLASEQIRLNTMLQKKSAPDWAEAIRTAATASLQNIAAACEEMLQSLTVEIQDEH